MLSDNILADRLNLYREGKLDKTPEGEKIKEVKKSETSSTFELALKIVELVLVFIRALVFGFAIKTILSSDWNFLALFAVGLSTEIILTNIFNLFKQENK